MKIEKNASEKPSVTISQSEWKTIGLRAGWLSKQAGEDWLVSEKALKLAQGVAAEAKRQGGEGTATGHKVLLSIDINGRFIPVRVEIFEGSWTHEIVANGYFESGGQQYPLPVENSGFPIETAKAIIDGLKNGFKWILSHAKK